MKTYLQFFLVLCVVLLCGVQRAWGQWTQIGLKDTAINGLAFSGTNLFAVPGWNGGHGVFLNSNNGSSWSAMNAGLPEEMVKCLAVSGGNIFAAIVTYGVFRTSDVGTSWTAVNTGITDLKVHSLAASGTGLYAGSDSGHIYFSGNNGTTWTQVAIPSNDCGYVSSLAVYESNLYASAYWGATYRSTDNGAHWTEIRPYYESSVLVWAFSGAFIFAGTERYGMRRFSNIDSIWTEINTGLPVKVDPTIYALAISETNLFAGTQQGVFLTKNNGDMWTAINEGLPLYRWVKSCVVNDKYLFVGLNNGGVWRRSIQDIISGIEDNHSDAATSFTLHQNYPNPISSSTTISFTIPSRSFVSLKVFDALGRQVSTLVSEERPARSYEASWDASGAPGGVYFYRLEAGGKVMTRKIIVGK